MRRLSATWCFLVAVTATERQIELRRTPDGLTVNLTIGAREQVRFLLDIGSASHSWVLADEATVLARDEATGLPIASFRTRHARVPSTSEVTVTDEPFRVRYADGLVVRGRVGSARVRYAQDDPRVLPNLGFAETLSEPTTRGGDALTLRSRSVFESSEYDALLAVGPSSIAQAVEMLSARPLPDGRAAAVGLVIGFGHQTCGGSPALLTAVHGEMRAVEDSAANIVGPRGAMIGIEPTAAPSMKQRWRLRAHERSRDAPGGEIQTSLLFDTAATHIFFPASRSSQAAAAARFVLPDVLSSSSWGESPTANCSLVLQLPVNASLREGAGQIWVLGVPFLEECGGIALLGRNAGSAVLLPSACISRECGGG